ncbi:MAG: hypothetical protein ACXWFC_13440 [Nitrososphaeraceae archaeon]
MIVEAVSLPGMTDPIRLNPPFNTRSPGSQKAAEIAKVPGGVEVVELLTEYTFVALS